MKTNTNTTPLTDQPWIDGLPLELRGLLDAELAAGNRVAFTAGTGPDPDTAILVMLVNPFRRTPRALPAGVTYHEHEHDWWDCEYRAGDPLCVLAAAPTV